MLYYCGGAIKYVNSFSKKGLFFCRRGMRRTALTLFLLWWLQITWGWYLAKKNMFCLRHKNMALCYIYIPNDGA